MKKMILVILGITISLMTYSQGILPDPSSPLPSNSHYYYKNYGQIIDNLDSVRNDVKYYTEKTSPALFLLEDRISFIHKISADTLNSGTMDTLNRIDLQFVCGRESKGRGIITNCATIHEYEVSDDHLNYYLPHCPSGITNVKGYARIVYENAFPDIDVHLYSTRSNVKLYFVIKPGGDPNDINLLFTGQDSITQIANSSLSMYLAAWRLQFPEATAYQIDSSNLISTLSWLPSWSHIGGGSVIVNTGTYDHTKRLVLSIGPSPIPANIDNLDWSVYYGDDGVQYSPRIDAEMNLKEMFHSMAESGGEFLAYTGSLTVPLTTNNGLTDFYVSKFEDTKREWATYYGGSNLDIPTAIKGHKRFFDNQTTEVWVGGITYSNDAPLLTSAPLTEFSQTANAGISGGNVWDGLLTSFDAETGILIYSTYFGGYGSGESIADITIDPENHKLFIVGSTQDEASFNNNCQAQTSGSFSLCSGNNYYFKGNKSFDDVLHGFIARFDLNNMELEWSTLFGGDGDDEIQSVQFHNGSLYVGGVTRSTAFNEFSVSPTISHSIYEFPLADPGNGEFFQNSVLIGGFNGITNMFVSKFNEDLQLEWSTLLGYSIAGIRDIKFNSSDDMYLLCMGLDPQNAASSSPFPNSSGLVPTYNNGNQYFETPVNNNQRMAVLKFDVNGALNWGTYLHTNPIGYTWNAPEGYHGAIAIGRYDELYVGTHINNVTAPVFNATNGYWQAQNASSSLPSSGWMFDSYILAFNNTNQLYWGTFFGGAFPAAYTTNEVNSYDILNDMAFQGNSLYITGATQSPLSPYNQCPYPESYCDITYNKGQDCFISRFRTDNIPNEIKQVNLSNLDMTVYPNPSNDVFHISFLNTKPLTKTELQIIDITGKLISKSSYTVTNGLNYFKIDLSNSANGIYILNITGGDINNSIQLIKK